MTDLFPTRRSGILYHFLTWTRDIVHDLAARHALRQEVLECERSGVLDSVLADLQMSRSQLEPLIENYPLSGKLFGAMAARLGIDPSYDAATRRAVQHTCAVCGHQRECRHWLESGRTEGYDGFCPNAEYWHAMKERVRLAATTVA